jgi:uncharacterized damage-inducible protein DinB
MSAGHRSLERSRHGQPWQPATSAGTISEVTHDDGVAQARDALASATDEHLLKPWRLLVAGNVVSQDARHVVLRDTFVHLAHHRGQLTVYLRLNGVPFPAIYGPSADDARFD